MIRSKLNRTTLLRIKKKKKRENVCAEALKQTFLMLEQMAVHPQAVNLDLIESLKTLRVQGNSC